ncbi:MAG: hypothetical protein AB7H86_10780 [Blastocatellales bacterium]
MKKYLLTALMLLLTAGAAPAQSTEGSAKPSKAEDELFRLLPASDLIATVDAGRAFNELLPQLANLSVGGVDKLAMQVRDFTTQTGIDPTKVGSLVIGLNLSGLQATGTIIVSGLEMDAAGAEKALGHFKTEFKASEYKGIRLYNLVSQVKAPTAGPLSVKTDETALALLGGGRIAFGDLSAVKNVIDISAGTAKGGISDAMIATFNETDPSRLLRFALRIPEELRQEATSQGDLFKSVATIKMILGTFDVAADLGLSLDTVMRTSTAAEASELETGLKGLVGLVRGFLGGGDPKMDLFGKLLDQVKVGSNSADVTLSIALPRSLMNEFTKKPEPAEKK